MNERVKNKRGQMQMSFGTIFSIILIIAFISFAVYGINKFLDVSKLAQVEKFKSDFQGDIDNMWKSTQGSQALEYNLPNKIKQVCFINDNYENMYFMPLDSDYNGKLLKNVDITNTIKSSTTTPKKLCITTSNGKISLTIKKAYDENLVTITK
jgi:hypothetical protein